MYRKAAINLDFFVYVVHSFWLVKPGKEVWRCTSTKLWKIGNKKITNKQIT